MTYRWPTAAPRPSSSPPPPRRPVTGFVQPRRPRW